WMCWLASAWLTCGCSNMTSPVDWAAQTRRAATVGPGDRVVAEVRVLGAGRRSRRLGTRHDMKDILRKYPFTLRQSSTWTGLPGAPARPRAHVGELARRLATRECRVRRSSKRGVRG